MGTRIKDRLEDAFDVNFDVSEIKIDTFDDFGRVLLEPYNGGEKLYYRGERIKSRTRRLIPTLLRHEDVIEEIILYRYTKLSTANRRRTVCTI